MIHNTKRQIETPICSIDNAGNKFWHIDGNHHREDGPAIEWANGGKVWKIHGICHRLDGPAYERPNGKHTWFIKGRIFASEEEFIKHKQLMLLNE